MDVDVDVAGPPDDAHADADSKPPSHPAPTLSHLEQRLHAHLATIVSSREARRQALDAARWRERLVELASERAARAGLCGWDPRLLMGTEEWGEEEGAGVLATYEVGTGGGVDGTGTVGGAGAEDEAGGEVKAEGEAEEYDGWCIGKVKCERHAGWQKLRSAEAAFERDTLESALAKLTTREREIRKKLEPPTRPPAPEHLKFGYKPTVDAHSAHTQNGGGHAGGAVGAGAGGVEKMNGVEKPKGVGRGGRGKKDEKTEVKTEVKKGRKRKSGVV